MKHVAIIMTHVALLLIAAAVIYNLSELAAYVIRPSDPRLYVWIVFHGLYYSPTFLIAYVGLLVVLPKIRFRFQGAFLAVGAGLLLWGLVYAFELTFKVVPDVNFYEEKRKEPSGDWKNDGG